MKKLTVVLLLIFLSISCKEAEDSTSLKKSPVEIDMSIGRDGKEFCELIEELKIVKLETTKHSMIGRINQIQVFDDKIFVHDIKTQSIFIFDYPNGDYIGKVESLGEGPDEYFYVSSFSVEKDKKLLVLLDITLSKVFKFNFKGEFIESKKIPFYAHSFSYFNDAKNLFFSNYSLSDDPDNDYQAIITDKNFNILNKFIKIDDFSSHQIEQENQISTFNNQISFLPKNDVMYYEVNNNEIKPKYFFDFNKNWDKDMFHKDVSSPKELIQILNKNEIIRSLGVVENDTFLLLDFWYIDKHYLALYNKETGDLNYVKKNKNGFENRFFVEGTFEDYYISYKYYDDLKVAVKNDLKCKVSENDKKMISNLSDIDNPILIFTKFKNQN
ncbi:MAG: 6-bladed beta-propeller [Bacteroidota bacterium]